MKISITVISLLLMLMLVECEYDFRLGTNGSQLASVAFSRLQKEIAKDGREPNVMSKGVPNKSISRKGSDAGASATTGGKKIVYKFVHCFALL